MATLKNAFHGLELGRRNPAGTLSGRAPGTRLPGRITRMVAPSMAVLSLAACGTTRNFVDHPALTVVPASTTPRAALRAVFGESAPMYISLCNADRASKDCAPKDSGLTARGVGGLFLPLTLHVRGIRVSAMHGTADGMTFDGAVDSKVDAIAPLCSSVHGQAAYGDDGTLSLSLQKFYCNWVLVGNVLVNAAFSVDSISVKDNTFTGFYRITFHGTGNAAGSGYFKATIEPGVSQLAVSSIIPPSFLRIDKERMR